jgi:hypothetical protein
VRGRCARGTEEVTGSAVSVSEGPRALARGVFCAHLAKLPHTLSVSPNPSTRAPSGEKATDVTCDECPLKVWISAPVGIPEFERLVGAA